MKIQFLQQCTFLLCHLLQKETVVFVSPNILSGIKLVFVSPNILSGIKFVIFVRYI